MADDQEPNRTFLQTAINQITGQADLYTIFEDFYKGKHPLNYASDKFKQKFGKRLQTLKDNMCKTVVKAPSSRLEVIGFNSDSSEIQDRAWKIWKRNLMPLRAKEIHRQAFKAGDAYAVVWYDPADDKKARIYPQKTSESIAVWQSEETGETEMAAKVWKGIDQKLYVTLYFPDRIEKWISKNEISSGAEITNAEDFEPRAVPGEAFPLEHDLGVVPVFHFSAGESLLTDAIPLQSGLNKALADLFVGMEFNSLRQRWTTGISYPIDEETGRPLVPFEVDEQWATTKSDIAKFGEFTDMDLNQTIAVMKDLREAIARSTGTPLHYLQLTGGQFPSGEALEKAEAPLTETVSDAQVAFGESWSRLMACCMKIETDEDLEIETKWKDAQSTGEKTQLENGILKKQLGWSDAQIQRDFGIAETEITKMAGEVKKQTSSIGAALGTAFDQGNIGDIG
jgi:hypothetical protein